MPGFEISNSKNMAFINWMIIAPSSSFLILIPFFSNMYFTGIKKDTKTGPKLQTLNNKYIPGVSVKSQFILIAYCAEQQPVTF